MRGIKVIYLTSCVYAYLVRIKIVIEVVKFHVIVSKNSRIKTTRIFSLFYAHHLFTMLL